MRASLQWINVAPFVYTIWRWWNFRIHFPETSERRVSQRYPRLGLYYTIFCVVLQRRPRAKWWTRPSGNALHSGASLTDRYFNRYEAPQVTTASSEKSRRQHKNTFHDFYFKRILWYFFGNGYSKTLCCHGKTGSGYLSLGHIPWQPIQIVNSLLMMLIGFNLPTVMMRNTVIKPLKFK